MNEEGIEPSPERTSDSMNEFLKRHGETLWGCDFFSIKSVTTKGIRDRDGKYTKKFTETLKQSGMQTNPLPIAYPRLNGRCERFIETIKLECLAKFIIFGKQRLDYYLICEFTSSFNIYCSHTARDHLPSIQKIPDEIEKLSP